jgi:hypothetical protein
MGNRCSSWIPLVTLLLCLGLGALIILPAIQTADLSVSGILSGDTEGDNLSYPGESDDDSNLVAIAGPARADLIYSISVPSRLRFQPANLSPVSPPPKHS